MQLDQDEAHFAATQHKHAEFMRYLEVNGLCSCSLSMLIGTLRKSNARRAQARLASAAAWSRRRGATVGLAPPTPDSPARTISSPSLFDDGHTPAAGGFGPRGVSTPAPRSLVPRASPALNAPTTRAVHAAGSPRAKENTELRAELAVLREAAGGHATELARAQYERAKRAKLEDEVVRADVS
ncbi:hypothetical protein T492DRAFT_1101058, partial [Pavlovales sp. CCMP2436]